MPEAAPRMDSRSTRCWQLSFVASRWRWVLWIVLLAALLGGIGYHLHEFRRQKVTAKLLFEPAFVTTTMLSGTRTLPGMGVPQLRQIVFSRSVLAMAAEECDLTGLWRCSREDAASRLDSLLSCHVGVAPPTLEIGLTKMEGADALKVCEAIMRQAEFAATQMEQDGLRHEIKILEMNAEFAASAVTDLEKARFFGSNDPRGWLTTPGLPVAKDLEGESKRLRSELDGLKEQIELKQMELKYRIGPLKITDAPHWDKVPLSERMRALGITLAWAIGSGMMLAILLAYVAEVLVPRRQDDPVA